MRTHYDFESIEDSIAFFRDVNKKLGPVRSAFHEVLQYSNDPKVKELGEQFIDKVIIPLGEMEKIAAGSWNRVLEEQGNDKYRAKKPGESDLYSAERFFEKFGYEQDKEDAYSSIISTLQYIHDVLDKKRSELLPNYRPENIGDAMLDMAIQIKEEEQERPWEDPKKLWKDIIKDKKKKSYLISELECTTDGMDAIIARLFNASRGLSCILPAPGMCELYEMLQELDEKRDKGQQRK